MRLNHLYIVLFLISFRVVYMYLFKIIFNFHFFWGYLCFRGDSEIIPNFKGEAGLWGQITYLSKNYRQLPNQKSI